eukprot:gene11911-13145_t
MSKYSTLPDQGQVSIYLDENERKDVLGKVNYTIIELLILVVMYLLWVVSLPVTWWCSFKVIPQYERALVYRLGRLQEAKGPGLIYIIPCIDRWRKVDMRMRAFNVPPQEVFTVDGGMLKIGADVQYRVTDPMASFNELQDLNHTLRVTAVTVLNSALAGKKLSEIENEKNYLNAILQSNLNRAVRAWGLETARFELTKSTIVRGGKGDDSQFVDPLESVISVFKGMSSSMAPMSMGPTALPKQPNPQLLKPAELFAMLTGILTEEIVKKVNAVFQFNLTGLDGGSWCLDLRNGNGFVGVGNAPCEPDVTIKMTSSDFQDMFYGRLSPGEAYMVGKITLDGDVYATTRLEELIKTIRAQTVA